MIKNIGIIGTGGVGGYFGSKLSQLQDSQPGVQVKFLARGEHLKKIHSEGLTLKAKGEPDLVARPTLATDKISEMGSLDLALICVKEFDLDRALHELRSVVNDSTVMIPLLNGVDSHARIRRVIKTGFAFPACVYIGTHIERPGVISQSGGACKIFFGPDPAAPDVTPHEVIKAFAEAGIKYEWKTGIQTDIWEKFIFIAGYGLVTATYNKTLGDVLSDNALKKEVVDVMTEAAALAKGLGVALPEQIVDLSVDKGNNFPPETKTSFQRDFEITTKPDERQLFAGSMLEIAKRLQIDAPHTRRLYRALNERKPVFWN